MNEPPPSPNDATPDDPVEARIVAWVLGEASAFEAAELERLCEEKPELLVFHRRMRELHGLLTEAEAAEPDDTWKLPAEKRKVLDEIFGQQEKSTAAAEETARDHRVNRTGRRALLAIAACVTVTFFVVRLVPTGYEAEATIEIKPRTNRLDSSGVGERVNTPTPQFFGTEFELIKSHNSLGKVVDKLDLTARWGMDRESAIKRVRASISTQKIRGTDLLSVRVREKTDEDAREITRAVTQTYADYRREIDNRDADKALAELNKAIREQEDKVEERRKVLSTIVRTKGIIYKGQDSFYGESGGNEDQGARTAIETYNQLTQEKMQAESQINSLLKYDGDQLRVYAAGLDVPDNLVRNLYPQYLEAGRQLETMKHKGLDDRSPDVLAMKDQVAGMKKQMDEGAVNLRATLQARLDMTTDRLKNVEDLKDNTREDAIKRGLDAQDYVDAKRDFEADQELLQQMRLKQVDRTLRDKMTDDSIVIHEMPKSVKRGIDILGGSGEKAKDSRMETAAAAQPAKTSTFDESLQVKLQEERGNLARNEKDGEVRYKLESEDKTRTRATDVQAEARQQQLAKNRPPADASAPPPAEPQAMPELAESSEMKPLARAEQDMSVAGNGSGFGGGAPSSLRMPRPRVTPTESASDETADSFSDVPERTALAGNVPSEAPASEPLGMERLMKQIQPPALADSAPSPAATTAPANPDTAVPSQSRAGVNLTDRSALDLAGASPDADFDMVKRLEGTKAPETRRFAAYTGIRLGESQPANSDGAWGSAYDQTMTGYVQSSVNDRNLYGNVGAPLDMVDRFTGNDAAQIEAMKKRDPRTQQVLGGVEHRFVPDSLGNDFIREQEEINPGIVSKENTDARSRQHQQNVDQIRENLYRAEGHFNLGKYDDAKKEYEEALRVDPENSAARRGLQRVATAQTQYQRANYGLTRAELLGDVDATWELATRQLESNGADSKKREVARIEIQRRDALAQADLAAEIPAVENPYSTFSLNISDASFQMAKAALAKGERPDPGSIKPEQFYNAVDYGDPAPAAGESVASTIEQAAHPVTPGRTLVRVAVRTGASGRSAAQPLRLTLLVDQSGSMVREDRRAAMDRALSQLSGLLTKADVVNVIGFSRTPHLLAEGMAGDQSNKLPSLVNQTASEGGTNLEEAMKLGGQLATRHQLAGAQNRIVLFTDGAANLGDADPARLAEQVKALRQNGISFDIAGIAADDLNDQLLGELARNGNGRYYVVGAEGKEDTFARQLAGAFRPAAENVKIQVIFNPRRVAKYKLIGFEKDRLKTEDFRNDSVDAAELAAGETGTAIYQVEEIPEGAGEIGELSVRFRDTASGEMVERSWTLPHATTATAFDRATPSMQLAGLSLLAAEKLRGGPLADAIDFKQLSSTIGSVKQYYGSGSRAGDMLRLIESIK